MSRSRRSKAKGLAKGLAVKALAASVIALVALTLLPTAPAEAFGLRGGPLGIMRSAMGRVLGIAGGHRGHRYARHERSGGSRSAALRPQDLRGAIDRERPLSSPVVRAQLTSVAALAGWHGGRADSGWWRHADGGYGWIGPLFWPFADDDLADYILFGRATGFFAYGYGDLHAAVFAPYGESELAAYASGRRPRRVPALDRFCGAEPDKSTLPVEPISDATQPNEAQRAALDELDEAWRAASAIIRTHCQTAPAPDGLARLSVMQDRVAAMIEATRAIAPALAKFDDVLDFARQQKLVALGEERRTALGRPAPETVAATATARPQGAACQVISEDAVMADPQAEKRARDMMARQWPVDQITASLHLSDTQSAALEVVQDTVTRILDPIDAACPQNSPATMQARLQAVQARLDALSKAIKATSAALDDFDFNLSAEQKAQFEAMGQSFSMSEPSRRGREVKN